jgi:hypothetical protein
MNTPANIGPNPNPSQGTLTSVDPFSGVLFGSGNTDPFILSYQAGANDVDIFLNWGPSLTDLGTVYHIEGLVFRAEGTARADTIPFPTSLSAAKMWRHGPAGFPGSALSWAFS